MAVLPATSAGAAPAASDLKEAEAKAVEAKFYYARGLFREAAETYFLAFTLSNRPDMLYNAARAYEQAKLLEKAKALYESYLLLQGVTDEGKRDAQARIAAIAQQLTVVEPARPEPPKPEPPKPEPPKPEPATPEPPRPEPAKPEPAKAQAVKPALPAPAPSNRDTVGLVALGSGAALTVGGAVLYGLARSAATKANRMDFSLPNSIASYNTAFDGAVSKRNIGAACAGVGIVAVAFGAWRMLRAPKAPGLAAAISVETDGQSLLVGATW